MEGALPPTQDPVMKMEHRHLTIAHGPSFDVELEQLELLEHHAGEEAVGAAQSMSTGRGEAEQ